MSRTESIEGSTTKLPADSAMLVVHADNSIEMHLPRMDDDDEAEVPVNSIVAAALGTFVRKDAAGLELIVQKFMSGGYGKD